MFRESESCCPKDSSQGLHLLKHLSAVLPGAMAIPIKETGVQQYLHSQFIPLIICDVQF